MGRYYYRPINPGYDQLAEQIVGGVQQGVQSGLALRDRERANRRQDVADKRADDLFEANLYRSGVRHGEAPADTFTPDDPLADAFTPLETPRIVPDLPNGGAPGAVLTNTPPSRRARTEVPLFGHEPIAGLDWMRRDATALPGRPASSFAVNFTQPGYQQITPDLFIDENATPEARQIDRLEASAAMQDARAAETSARNAAVKEAQRQSEEDAIYQALTAADPSVSPERARSHARVASYDPTVADKYLFPREEAPVRGTQAYLDAIDKEETIRDRHQAGRTGTALMSRGPGGLTRNEALSQARSLLTRKVDDETVTGTPEEVRGLADDLFEGVHAPTMHGVDEEAPSVSAVGGRLPAVHAAPPAARGAPPRGSAPAAGGATSKTPPPATRGAGAPEAEAAAIAKNIPDAKLKELGYSQATIDRLKGRKPAAKGKK